jgi:NADPH2:quinone reductase
VNNVVVFHAPGGPEVLALEQQPLPVPGPGEVVVRVARAGVNFIDIYYRSGAYRADLPARVGQEGAGTVEQVGEGVRDLRPGDRVAWAAAIGSYATQVLVPAAKLVPVPDALSLEDAAAVLMQGITAQYLSHSVYPIRAGDDVLVHAAAGGVGLLLTQMAKERGARVIATVSTDEKAVLAREAGADEVIVYGREEVAPAVRALTGGVGVHVVYDAVGKTTFAASLDSLRPRGYFVLYGAASGPPPPIEASTLQTKGSLFFTRPTIVHYTAERAELLARASDVFGMVVSGALRVRIGGRYPLAEAARAQSDLESRRSTGKLLLVTDPGAY